MDSLELVEVSPVVFPTRKSPRSHYRRDHCTLLRRAAASALLAVAATSSSTISAAQVGGVVTQPLFPISGHIRPLHIANDLLFGFRSHRRRHLPVLQINSRSLHSVNENSAKTSLSKKILVSKNSIVEVLINYDPHCHSAPYLRSSMVLRLPYSATVADLKALIRQSWPGNPPEALQQLFFGSSQLIRDTQHLIELIPKFRLQRQKEAGVRPSGPLQNKVFLCITLDFPFPPLPLKDFVPVYPNCSQGCCWFPWWTINHKFFSHINSTSSRSRNVSQSHSIIFEDKLNSGIYGKSINTTCYQSNITIPSELLTTSHIIVSLVALRRISTLAYQRFFNNSSSNYSFGDFVFCKNWINSTFLFQDEFQQIMPIVDQNSTTQSIESISHENYHQTFLEILKKVGNFSVYNGREAMADFVNNDIFSNEDKYLNLFENIDKVSVGNSCDHDIKDAYKILYSRFKKCIHHEIEYNGSCCKILSLCAFFAIMPPMHRPPRSLLIITSFMATIPQIRLLRFLSKIWLHLASLFPYWSYLGFLISAFPAPYQQLLFLE